MKIIQQRSFGGPEVLQVAEVPRPEPGPGEVLVRVAAAGVNPVDAKTRRGDGAAGLMGKFPITVGWDIAGTVESTGSVASDDQLHNLSLGDRVLGMVRFPHPAAAYADFVIAPVDELVRIPNPLSDSHAAGLPMAALTAWQALRDVGGLSAGQRLLVHGAGGGVGHLAVQIARYLDAHVVATASRAKRDWLIELGAEQVIDYVNEDFVDELRQDPVDVVLDLIGGTTGTRSVAVLKPGGVLLEMPDTVAPGTQAAAATAGVRAAHPGVHTDRAALERIAGLAAAGTLAVTVTGEFPLERASDAHRMIDQGHVRGKLLLRP